MKAATNYIMKEEDVAWHELLPLTATHSWTKCHHVKIGDSNSSLECKIGYLKLLQPKKLSIFPHYYLLIIIIRQGLTTKPWMIWNLIGGPSRTWTQPTTHLCLQSAGIKGLFHHTAFFLVFLKWQWTGRLKMKSVWRLLASHGEVALHRLIESFHLP